MHLFYFRDDGELDFKNFNTPNIPKYAILSHRWRDPEEVLFTEVKELDSLDPNRSGVKKIRACAELARKDGLGAFWIDSCCIDKSSSAELQEAINSMFHWYGGAETCYIYLDDVNIECSQKSENDEGESIDEEFRRENGEWSEWFERAWTLQELIAPSRAVFFDRHWVTIGERCDFAETLSRITGIPAELLQSSKQPGWKTTLSVYSVAQRMSWASGRKATRVEDEAYSLIGLFDVGMPMLYGEGIRAFRRLQEEIIKQRADQTIFAWGQNSLDQSLSDRARSSMIFAQTPKDFSGCEDITIGLAESQEFRQSNVGLEIKLPTSTYGKRHFAVLNCRSDANPSHAFVLEYKRVGSNYVILLRSWYQRTVRTCRMNVGEIPRDLSVVKLCFLHETELTSHPNGTPPSARLWTGWHSVFRIKLHWTWTNLSLGGVYPEHAAYKARAAIPFSGGFGEHAELISTYGPFAIELAYRDGRVAVFHVDSMKLREPHVVAIRSSLAETFDEEFDTASQKPVVRPTDKDPLVFRSKIPGGHDLVIRLLRHKNMSTSSTTNLYFIEAVPFLLPLAPLAYTELPHPDILNEPPAV